MPVIMYMTLISIATFFCFRFLAVYCNFKLAENKIITGPKNFYQLAETEKRRKKCIEKIC